jgi:dolichol-phosphate mannosyltransferase
VKKLYYLNLKKTVTNKLPRVYTRDIRQSPGEKYVLPGINPGSNKLVSVVIPTYNEKDNIIKLIRTIYSSIKKDQKADLEVVVVDDNSPDMTGDLVKKEFNNNKSVKVIIRKERGLGTAIKRGVMESSGDLIVGMDADFNHDPRVIPLLIDETKRSDLVVASRFITGGGMDDRVRYFLTKIFNLGLKIILGFPTTDNMSGFYSIRKTDLEKLNIEKIFYGYGDYHLRLVYLAKKKDFVITEVPCYYKERSHGKSKSNLFKMFVSYSVEAIRLRFFSKN